MTFRAVVFLLVGAAVVAAAIGLSVAAEPVETIAEKWEGSTHADAESEAFTHWDGASVIPPRCASCHSTIGFRDFLGADGTAAGEVDGETEVGTVVYCTACHNPAAEALTTLTFPSGVEVDELEDSAVCNHCHQGRASTDDVEEAVGDLDPDTISDDLEFINVHYYVAAATLWGGEVRGGYQYDDRTYVGRFEHVPDVNSCAECHDPHSQEVPYEACTPCHVAVGGPGDVRLIRTDEVDYDGDGDLGEGLHGEIQSMQEELYAAIQSYAAEVAEPLVYSDSFPYYFRDDDGDGEPDEGEVDRDNRYRAWTPRLLRAAYNYHFSLQDPGNYAHNGRYVVQLLYDSLNALGQTISVDMDGLVRPTSD
jgi:hypothetical protein